MKTINKAIPLALVTMLALAACGGGDGGGGGGGSTSTSSGGQTGASVDVRPCLGQTIPNGQAGGPTVASLVVPDVLKLDLAGAQGFPNGRQLSDPVIDVTLAVLFLKLGTSGQNAATFASLPLNPPNDSTFQSVFPYLGVANGGAPAPGTGTGFVFRTEPASAFTRVDRMGMPAVATALVGSTNKLAYNDDNPAVDATGKWVPEFTQQLTGLTTALADDLTALKLTPCATVS